VQVPGLANIWVPPIRNRIDMLATGIKSPVGIKVAGADLADIDRVARRSSGGRDRARGVVGARRAPHRRALCRRRHRPRRRRALRPQHRRRAVGGGQPIGGENIGETVEGLARYPINVRYPREWRDTPEKLAALPILTPGGSQITLGMVARVSLSDGPPMLKSENARLSGWVYVDVRGRDLSRPPWPTCKRPWPPASSSNPA
jgi:copper/silver efflux system protein